MGLKHPIKHPKHPHPKYHNRQQVLEVESSYHTDEHALWISSWPPSLTQTCLECACFSGHSHQLHFRLQMEGTQEFAWKRLGCRNLICNICLWSWYPTITLAHNNLVLLYLQQSMACPLLKNSHATLGSYQNFPNRFILLRISNIFRNISLETSLGFRKLFCHTKANQKTWKD